MTIVIKRWSNWPTIKRPVLVCRSPMPSPGLLDIESTAYGGVERSIRLFQQGVTQFGGQRHRDPRVGDTLLPTDGDQRRVIYRQEFLRFSTFR
jgi:hypothetical protein